MFFTVCTAEPGNHLSKCLSVSDLQCIGHNYIHPCKRTVTVRGLNSLGACLHLLQSIPAGCVFAEGDRVCSQSTSHYFHVLFLNYSSSHWSSLCIVDNGRVSVFLACCLSVEDSLSDRDCNHSKSTQLNRHEALRPY